MGDNLKSDGQLLDEYLRTGEEARFTELVGRHTPMILTVCLRTTGNPQHTQDAVQAVLLTLYRKAKSLRGHASIAGWLYHTARNISLHARRDETLRKTREEEASMMIETNISEKIHREELVEFLDDELDRLPE